MNLSNVLNGRIKEEQKEELIDIAIFFADFICSFCLTLRTINSDGVEEFNDLIHPGLLWPICIVFIGITVLLAYRRWKYAHINPWHKIIGPLFAAYILVKLLTYSFYPNNETILGFESHHTYYSFNLIGYSFYQRYTEWFEESLLVISYYVMFVYYSSFKMYRKKVLYFSLSIVLIIAFLIGGAVFISYMCGNKPLIFQTPGTSYEELVKNDFFKVVQNKNIYGLFFMFGVMACLSLTIMNPNIIWTVIAIIFTGFSLLLDSRSTFGLSSLCLAGIMLIAPFFSMKKHRFNLIANLSLAGIFLICVLVIMYGFKDSEIGKGLCKLVEHFTNKGTINSRHLLTENAVDMVSSDFYFVMCGFGKIGFFNNFRQFQLLNGGELVFSAHQAWAACLSTSGVIGLVFVIILDLVVIYMVVNIYKIRKYDVMFFLGWQGLILLLYTFVEYRMLFYVDSFVNSTMVFYLAYLFPVLYYYSLVKDTQIIKENMPESLVYPSIEE